jgi:hypothetical protein
MKWLFALNEKVKVAFFLVAGAAISTIIELNYQNHLHLEEHIHTNKVENYNRLEEGIRHNNKAADSLLTEFKKTVLVAPEKKALEAFMQTNLKYREFQGDLLSLSRYGDKATIYEQYLKKGNTLFEKLLTPAHQLSSIQISVGQDIYKASQHKIHGAQVISMLEAALVIIILVGTYAIMIVSQSIINKPQKFWLN